MSEGPADGGMDGGLDADLPGLDAEPVDAELVDDGPPADGEDVVDAEFVVITPDGTELSSGTELEVAPVTVTLTDVDGQPVDPETGFATLPGIGERPAGGMATGSENRDEDAKDHGQPRGLIGGGGSKRRRKLFGGSSGNGSGGPGALFGITLSFFSGASVVRSNGPVASPQVTTGIVANTGASKPKALGRRPSSSGPRRPIR